jgi:hypothetical protein
MRATVGLNRMNSLSDRLAYIVSELSKEPGASPDIGRAARWIVEQRHPHISEAERVALAEFAAAEAARIERASIVARPSSRINARLRRMAG